MSNKEKTPEQRLKDFKKSNTIRREYLAKKEGFGSVEEFFIHLVWDTKPKKERGFSIMRFIRALFGHDKTN